MSREEAEIESPTGYDQCPVCGEIIKSKGKYGHFSRRHSELNYEEYKDKFKPAKPPEAPAPPEGGAPYKVEPDVNAILRDILETSQKNKLITQSVVDEIMDWANRMGSMDPNYLTYLLTGMRGVSAQTANIISSKYAMTLQKAQQEGRVQLPFPIYPPTMPTAPTMFPTFPYQPTSQQPFYWSSPTMPAPTTPTMPAPTMPTTAPGMPAPTGYPPTPGPYVTKEDLNKMLREREEKSELTKLKERMEQMDKDFAGALTSQREEIVEAVSRQIEALKPGEEKVVLPLLDEKGSPIVDSKTGEARTITVPSHMALYVMMGMRKGLTEEDIRKIIKEEKPAVESIEEHPVVKELRERATKTEEKLDKEREERLKVEREMREKEEERRHKETLEAIKTIRQPPTGVTTTEGVLATAIQEAGRIAERKEPVRVIVEAVAPPGVTPRKPPSEKAGVEERGGVLQELAKEGLAVRVLERRR